MAVSRIFDGDVANFLEDAAFGAAAPPFTIACWVRFDALLATSTVIGFTDRTANADFHSIDGLSSGAVRAISRAAGSSSSGFAPGTITDTAYHHVAGVWATSASREGFLDGVGGGPNTDTRVPADLDTFAVGLLRRSTPTTPMDGAVAWPCVWNVALTDAEIASLATGAYPTSIRPEAIVAFYQFDGSATELDATGVHDLTENGTVGQASDADVLVGEKPFGLGRVVDGVNTRQPLTVGITISAPFTMACWAKLDSLVNSHRLMTIAGAAFPNEFFSLEANLTGNVMRAQIAGSGVNVASNAPGVWGITEYHHGAAVFGSDSLIRGYLEGVGGVDNTTFSIPAGTDTLGVGYRPAGTQVMNGSLAWPCIWGVALNDDEIAQLAAGAYPTSIRPADIIHFWPFKGVAPELDTIGSGDLVVGAQTLMTDGVVEALVEDWRADLVEGLSAGQSGLSRVFDQDVANFLEKEAPTFPALPFTMACWVKPDILDNQSVMWAGDKGSSADYHSLELAVGGGVNAVSRTTAGGFATSGSIGPYTTGVFTHHAGVWTSDTERLVYHDGVSGNLNNVSAVGIVVDRLSVGLNRDSSPSLPMDGNIAWSCIWNVALTSAEIAALANGAYPASVRPNNIVSFWPFQGANPEADIVGVNHLSVNGTLATAVDADVLVGVGEWDKVQQGLRDDLTRVVRTSPTVVTITLPPTVGYDILTDQLIEQTVPASSLLDSGGSVVATPTFTVLAVSAVISGTVVPDVDEPELVAGGETIIITMDGDEFHPEPIF